MRFWRGHSGRCSSVEEDEEEERKIRKWKNN